MKRRTVLGAGGALAAGVVTVAAAASQTMRDDTFVSAARAPSAADDVERETERLLPGTEHETPLHAIDASEDGPTVMVFGGIHGDEYNGIDIANEMVDWNPEAGTVVVVPEANRVAVENEQREGIDGDLNRMFPLDREPITDLARGIWDAVERHDPDVVLDLHRSLGIYGLHDRYVGQAVFHTPDAHGDELAASLNEDLVPWYMPAHRFVAMESTQPSPLLFKKAAHELGSTAYLFETTRFMLDRSTKNAFTRAAAARVLALHGLLETDADTDTEVAQ
ncbi:succinylglutamate desuccinylase/aspartoacylase family protein [Natronosalvus halobius]|uniref:succinylglutamate desuccinylase/aspartoacylase family protein n=1 Tax=Natronosalvus halobius TaxID=2953746 RepID=UPI00209E673A|nr:succinylglutamate desuccinylase/aspartoacylase family protein [Natronosalvus halobius]USZ72823.1 succinylglutamate desuccinylase/aspartoacylase family protein [Natronosalvus halobius]